MKPKEGFQKRDRKAKIALAINRKVIAHEIGGCESPGKHPFSFVTTRMTLQKRFEKAIQQLDAILLQPATTTR